MPLCKAAKRQKTVTKASVKPEPVAVNHLAVDIEYQYAATDIHRNLAPNINLQKIECYLVSAMRTHLKKLGQC